MREAQAAAAEVRDVIEHAQGQLEQAAARMHGAMQLLARYERHPRKLGPVKPAGTATASQELLRAFEGLGVGSEKK